MNVIFGSGIVGLIAKAILGPEWTIVPFKRSRFFSWNPALDDNFIICDDELDPFIKSISQSIGVTRHIYNRAWSIQGQVYPRFDASICEDWLRKIFGNDFPSHAMMYMKDRMTSQIYDIRVNHLYHNLVNLYMEELKSQDSRGPVTQIGNHFYIINGQKYEFDRAVSTIPLDSLLSLMNIDMKLKTKPIHYVHIHTTDLDFEGNNQLLVADPAIDFWKVTNVAKDRYLIYFSNDVLNYGLYLMNYIKQFEILDGTMVEQAIVIGDMPQTSEFEETSGIFCVGSYAQWDWCADVGSNILRLLRYANRDGKPKQWQEIKR
jgi:hypothetical protein